MGEARSLADGIWVLPLRTPTLPPAIATNTLVVAGEKVAVIEPATPHAEERRRLDNLLAALAAEGRALAAILVTHHHADHVGYVEALRQRHGVPVLAHRATAERVPFAVDRRVDEGEVIDLGSGTVLDALHTPGHAPGHLAYVERRSGVVHAGDLVAGEGTILVDPDDDGDMAAYLDSLRRLQELDTPALVPAHGPVQCDARIAARTLAHRLERERKVLAAIGSTPTPFDEVLAVAYDDTPRGSWPLAARALRAHIDKLVAEQQVEVGAGRLRRLPPT